jgi:hypothetical protein
MQQLYVKQAGTLAHLILLANVGMTGIPHVTLQRQAENPPIDKWLNRPPTHSPAVSTLRMSREWVHMLVVVVADRDTQARLI